MLKLQVDSGALRGFVCRKVKGPMWASSAENSS